MYCDVLLILIMLKKQLKYFNIRLLNAYFASSLFDRSSIKP